MSVRGYQQSSLSIIRATFVSQGCRSDYPLPRNAAWSVLNDGAAEGTDFFFRSTVPWEL